MTRHSLILLLILIAQPLVAQVPQPLFPAQGIGNWTNQNGEADFFAVTGSGSDTVLRVSGDSGWLQSPQTHGDFLLRGEFRFLEADSDSGIFVRVEAGTDFIRGWPGDAYQVQIRDISVNLSDNPLPLLNLYRHRVAPGSTVYDRDTVSELYTGVGQWQQIEIVLKDNVLTASLNGEIVLQAEDIENTSGYLGFQSEKGIIEYRNLTIETR